VIEVNVQNLAFDRASNTPVVILREVGTDRVLPIWIGPGEASAIAMHLGGVSFQRPLTHDLLVSILGGLGGTLQRVLITRVEDSTYFAELIIDRDGDLISVDARPSDSIAMALRAQARIFADDALLESASQALDIPGSDEPDDEDETQISGEALEEHLRKLRPEDLGRFDH
jgi:bifunctional DNase/RNase